MINLNILKQLPFKKLNHALMVLVIAHVFLLFPGNAYTQNKSSFALPDGTQFDNWEVPVTYTKTYYVDNGNRSASDSNPGTQEQPFLTIGKAAEVLQPGERVVIHSGIYRESVRPLRGGSGPDKLISYEAAPGAKVIVKGSVVASKDKWAQSNYSRGRAISTPENPINVLQYNFEDIDFKGYNPFGMLNVMHDDRQFFPFSIHDQVRRTYLRRGMIYVDGRRMTQVENLSELRTTEDAFWVEQDGLTVHLRLRGNANPASHDVEFVIHERVFAPKTWGQGYIRLKGITFEHAANVTPWPQRGIVSLNRGHHFIIEDCVVRHANAVGIDTGRESIIADSPGPVGSAIIRRTHIYDIGVSGICGIGGGNSLIESCLFEDIGWQRIERNLQSGAIRMYSASNTVVANCVFRNISYAPGVWFDVDCINSRITNNVFLNITNTIKAAICMEARSMVDHNIIWNITNMEPEELTRFNRNTWRADNLINAGRGIQVDGSDEGIYAHNLIGMCGTGLAVYHVENRTGESGDGKSRWNNVANNIFYRNTTSIEIPSQNELLHTINLTSDPRFKDIPTTEIELTRVAKVDYQPAYFEKMRGNIISLGISTATYADGNLYGRTIQAAGATGGGGGSATQNRIVYPENLKPDIVAWQRFFGYDQNGGYLNTTIQINPDDLTLTWLSEGDTPNVATGDLFKVDFLGNTAVKNRKAGPFAIFPENNKTISIDPRKKSNN